MILAMSILGGLFIAYCAWCAIWAGWEFGRQRHSRYAHAARTAFALSVLAYVVAGALVTALVFYLLALVH